MNQSNKFLAVISLCALAIACGGNSEQEQLEDELRDAAKAMQEAFEDNPQKAEDVVRSLNEALGQIGEKVETIPAKELKNLLPVEVSGMTRTAYSASKKGIQGFSISFTDAKFEENGGNGSLELSITDIGNMSGLASVGLDVLNVEIDEENQDGFQRTGLYKGHKSFTSHTKQGSSTRSEMMVFVDNRFVVKALGEKIDWDLLEDVVDSIPVKQLESLTN